MAPGAWRHRVKCGLPDFSTNSPTIVPMFGNIRIPCGERRLAVLCGAGCQSVSRGGNSGAIMALHEARLACTGSRTGSYAEESTTVS